MIRIIALAAAAALTTALILSVGLVGPLVSTFWVLVITGIAFGCFLWAYLGYLAKFFLVRTDQNTCLVATNLLEKGAPETFPGGAISVRKPWVAASNTSHVPLQAITLTFAFSVPGKTTAHVIYGTVMYKASEERAPAFVGTNSSTIRESIIGFVEADVSEELAEKELTDAKKMLSLINTNLKDKLAGHGVEVTTIEKQTGIDVIDVRIASIDPLPEVQKVMDLEFTTGKLRDGVATLLGQTPEELIEKLKIGNQAFLDQYNTFLEMVFAKAGGAQLNIVRGGGGAAVGIAPQAVATQATAPSAAKPTGDPHDTLVQEARKKGAELWKGFKAELKFWGKWSGIVVLGVTIFMTLASFSWGTSSPPSTQTQTEATRPQERQITASPGLRFIVEPREKVTVWYPRAECYSLQFPSAESIQQIDLRKVVGGVILHHKGEGEAVGLSMVMTGPTPPNGCP